MNWFVLVSQFYFKVPRAIQLNATYFIMKLPNKKELKQGAFNHSSDTEFKDLMKLYKDFTKEPFSFLVNNTILPSDNLLRFRKNQL